MFHNIREKWGKSEPVERVAATEYEVTEEAAQIAKRVVFLSKEPMHGPNPQLDSALDDLAAELGFPQDMDRRTVQEKAFEISRLPE